MEKSKNRGIYSRSFITNTPADLDSEIAKAYSKTIKHPEVGIYIYSFKENRMLYADGWEEVIGKPSSELGMLDVVNFSAPDYAEFVDEINDKALEFLHCRNENLTAYSFTIEIKIMHEAGHEIPVMARVSVHDCDEEGNLASIMGSFQINRKLRFGKVMRFATYGPPDKREFEEALDSDLFKSLAVTNKEVQALQLVGEGVPFKQIADRLNVSQSAIEKRIYGLFKRFQVSSLAHLIRFAMDNELID